MQELHDVLERYFENNVMKNDCKEVRIVMENWHKDFCLEDLKKKLDYLISETVPQKSLISSHENIDEGRLIKFTI